LPRKFYFRSPLLSGGITPIDPHEWLTSTLTSIVNGHKQRQIDDLLPWNYAAKV
jgi:IS66 C-terminal element